MKYPVDVTDFETIRKEGRVYVDKTAYIYKMANPGGPFFLMRPRCFGKTLFVSTLKAYFEGRKDLFKGLAIEKLEKEWAEHPVFHFDFADGNYKVGPDALPARLNTKLKEWEELYGAKSREVTLSQRFEGVVRRAYEKTGQRVAILVDEYDKPILETMDSPELNKKNRSILRSVFRVTKSRSDCTRFVFITGVTTLSVLSDLNISIISLSGRYSDICGITEEELHRYFDVEIKKLALSKGMTFEAACGKLKDMYYGYMFAGKGARVYNPYSLLNALDSSEFGTYWYQTGETPHIKLMSDENFNLKSLNGKADDFDLTVAEGLFGMHAFAVLYQSGYLTIKGWDEKRSIYTLGLPDGEVRKNFLEYLAERFLKTEGAAGGFMSDFVREVRAGEPEAFLSRLKAAVSATPYRVTGCTDLYFRNTLYLVFSLAAGAKITLEDYFTCYDHTSFSADTGKYVYVIKLGINTSAKKALEQINDAECLAKYPGGKRKIFKIGVACRAKSKSWDRSIVSWRIGEIPG